MEPAWHGPVLEENSSEPAEAKLEDTEDATPGRTPTSDVIRHRPARGPGHTSRGRPSCPTPETRRSSAPTVTT